MGQETFTVIWHPEAVDDLEDATDHKKAASIVRGAGHKLSVAPYIFGKPLAASSRLLWRAVFGGFRAIYTVLEDKREVVVLSLRKRSIVYDQRHLDRLMKLALALQNAKL